MSIFSEKTRANKFINSLFIGLVIVLSSGCSGLYEASPEDLPNQSDGQYPAEISGEVTIAEKFKWATAIPVPADEGRVFWIQEITIKNVSYPEPIEASASSGGWTKWRLVYDDEERWWRTCVPEDIYIDKGESTTFWTYCEMPRYVEIGDVQIRYTGQEPYSYGELTLIHEVEAYDFFTKKGIEEEPTEEPAKEEIAQVKNIDNWQIQLVGIRWNGSTLNVNLIITNLGARRNFGFSSFSTLGQPQLAVIDSTGKKIDPWVRQPDFSQGELIVLPPYAKEYYPNESWSGNLRFDMSPYSGKTILYVGRYSWLEKWALFDLGSP